MNLLSTIVGSGLTLQDNYQWVHNYIITSKDEGWVLVSNDGYELEYVNAQQGIGIIFVDGADVFKLYPLQLEAWNEVDEEGLQHQQDVRDGYED